VSPLYRPVELVPGVELRPGTAGRRAILAVQVNERDLERDRAGGPREVLTTLDERALEELAAAAREALE
jgi:hypothetical protein